MNADLNCFGHDSLRPTERDVGWATFGCGAGRFGSLGAGFQPRQSAVAAALCRRTPKGPRVAYPPDSSVSDHERKSGVVCGEEFATQARREVLLHGPQSIIPPADL